MSSLSKIESYFDFDLIKSINEKNKLNNYIISPIGLEIILSLCINGAKGHTQKEILNILKYKSIGEVNNISYNIISELNKKQEIKLANGILTKIHPKDKYIRIGKEKYDANIEELKNYIHVNKWVSDKTNNKITEIIDYLSPNVMMILLNAIYFEAFWAIKFDMNQTYDKEFFNIDETKTIVELMFLRDELLNYYENDTLKAVKLNYDIKYKSLNAIIILPKNEDYLEENITNLIENFDSDIYYDIINNLDNDKSKTRVNFFMPKFKLEFKYDMKKILEDMGMKKAFTKEAEFNNISEKMKLFVNQVLQKNYINVNEEGTQACSITELEVVLECYVVKAENAKDFIANRPFIFILRDGECPKGHDIILFTKICRFNQKE